MDWIPRTIESPTDADLRQLREEYSFSEPFLRILWRRGIRSAAEAEAFLHPERQPLPDPSLLTDMDRAAARIRSAIEAQEPICIYGDYDVDGVCATTILVRALTALGAHVTYYIPLRQSEGYGMHEESVRAVAARGTKLLITVDNGISAHAEVALANTLGMEVIVTDHHRCHETLPKAHAVVCATRPGQDESVRTLCGASVAMLLAVALGQSAERFLAIAALASVADVMPLVGFNRTIVARGMALIRSEPGLCALLDAAGAKETEPVTETTLAFLLAPRINAAGRMGDARRAAKLLLADDDRTRRDLAAELDAANAARKSEEQRILTEAQRQIDPSAMHRLLMLCGTDWNPGVIGIVASRIVERYGCPVLLFTGLGDELAGSGRSVPGVDLFGLLSRHAAFFTRFGGHLLAAGAAMHPASFEPCRRALMQDLSERYPNGIAPEPIVYEDALSVSDCTTAFCDELALLAPFGEGNREPLFLLRGELSGVRAMGREGTHMSATLSENGAALRLVGFRMGDWLADRQALKTAEALCTLRTNAFMGEVSANGYLCAVRAVMADRLREAAEAFLNGFSERDAKRVADAAHERPNEERIRRIFVELRPRLLGGVLADCLSEEALLTLLVLTEAGVTAYVNGVFFEQVVTEKKRLMDGRLYRALQGQAE